MNKVNIILYTTNCPRCVVLEKKLNAKNIEYETITDKKTMLEKGFITAPMLEVNGELLDFSKANQWINEQ